jgi:hypothetical protein
MSTLCPNQATLEKLIALGQCADGDARISELLGTLKANAYVASIHPFQDFEWLRDIPWTGACAVVRAVVRLEAAQLTKSGGSASAIKSAYRTMEDSDRVGAMELAAWIVDHSDNDYIPFPMCKIRHAFEGIKRTAGSWSECREALDCWCADEWGRQRRVAEEMANQKPEGEHRRQIHNAVSFGDSGEVACALDSGNYRPPRRRVSGEFADHAGAGNWLRTRKVLHRGRAHDGREVYRRGAAQASL